MDDVPRAQMDAHDLVDWDVQVVIELDVVGRVKLAIRPGINDFPVKLLRRNLQLKIAVRRVPLHLGPCRYAYKGEDDQDGGRNNRPDDLQSSISVRVGGALPFSLAVHDQEDDHQYRDQN